MEKCPVIPDKCSVIHFMAKQNILKQKYIYLCIVRELQYDIR